MTMSLKNMDMACAEYGSQIGKIEHLSESLINRSLGVLQEGGIYAFFLFLASRGKGEKDQSDGIRKIIFSLLKDFPGLHGTLGAEENILEDVRNKLAEDLDGLFLARDLMEHTLVYARYHLKAKGRG